MAYQGYHDEWLWMSWKVLCKNKEEGEIGFPISMILTWMC